MFKSIKHGFKSMKLYTNYNYSLHIYLDSSTACKISNNISHLWKHYEIFNNVYK